MVTAFGKIQSLYEARLGAGRLFFDWAEGNDALSASEFTEEGVKRVLEFDEQ